MKPQHTLSYLLLAATALASCAGHHTGSELLDPDDALQTFTYKDSSDHLILSLALTLPTATDSATTLMRDSLIADFIRSAQAPGYQEGEAPIARYSGEADNFQALVDYYGKADYDLLHHLALDDFMERTSFLETDTTLSVADKQRIKEDIPQWAYDYSLQRITDTPRFAVYHSEAYVYCGGAHGGVVGTGAMTFDKTTGHKIARFINPDAAPALQPLLRQGLIHYYSQCGDTITDQQLTERLFIEDGIVPLPAQAAHPNAAADSLIFTYAQYEIACYADGMPSFPLAVKDLLPHLTPEANALLKK